MTAVWRVIAIDPGPEQSAILEWDGARIVSHRIGDNDSVRAQLDAEADASLLVVLEQVESFGMAVGRDVFQTVFETGRMYEFVQPPTRRMMLPRRAAKMHLCASVRAKDSNIRQALIDRFGGNGGRRTAVGVKSAPGPLYGIRSHEWAALALAVTAWDQDLHEK